MSYNMAKRYIAVLLTITYIVLAILLVNFFKGHNSNTPLMVDNVESIPLVLPESTDTTSIDPNSEYFKQLTSVRHRIARILESLPVNLNTVQKNSAHKRWLKYPFRGMDSLSFQARRDFVNCNPLALSHGWDGNSTKTGPCLYPCGERLAATTKEVKSNLTLHFQCSNFTDLRFIGANASMRWPVALASFPGSGATWLRYLVEQVTGIFSGSEVCDASLKRVGYFGEGVHTSDVAIVRVGRLPCNFSDYSNCTKFNKVVILLRNPYSAILSEYNRMITHSHVEKLPLEHYRANFSTWNKTVYYLMDAWRASTEAWLTDEEVPMKCIVEYNALKRDIPSELQRVVKFINLPLAVERLSCIKGPLFSPFRLQSVDQYLAKANPYTRAHSLHLNSMIRSLSTLFEQYNVPYYTWFRFH
jgi:hypothetical protein